MKNSAKALLLVNFSKPGDASLPFASEISQNRSLQNLASCRLQLQPIAKALEAIGLEVYSISPLKPLESLSLFDNVKLIIVGKITVKPEKSKICHAVVMQHLLAAKKLDIPIITTYSNHHLSDIGSIFNQTYRGILAQSKKIICPSQGLTESLTKLGDWSVETIEDPCITPPYSYKKLGLKNTINILWYGSTMNLNPLLEKLPFLLKLKSNRSFALDILTGDLKAHQKRRISEAKQQMSPSWNITCQQWTHEKHLIKLEKAHYTLLPCENNQYSEYASSNRLLDAISGGTIPIASPIPSYRNLGEVAILSNHLISSFIESIKSYDEISKTFEARRGKLLKDYSLERTVIKYKNLFSKFLC